MRSLRFWWSVSLLPSLLASTICLAADTGPVNLTTELPSLDIVYNNSVVTIERIQNNENTIKGTFAKTSRPCPPACIAPMHPVDNIVLVGELELLEYMEKEYLSGNGLIIDARAAPVYSYATIPGSLNLPAQEFANLNTDKSNYLIELVNAAERPDTGKFMQLMESFGFFADNMKTADIDFTNARKVLIWDSGPWSTEAHAVIDAFRETGYPAEYIHYYHGGMQSWLSFGLTIVKP